MKPHIRVAIVDDHPMLRKGLISILSDVDIQVVIEAGNGRELLAQLEKAKELPEICITDINMPEMNGFETAENLRKLYPGIRILVYSFYEHDFSIINMIKKGAVGYLFKSVDPSEVITAVQTITEHGYYHSDAISKKIPSILYNSHSLQVDFKEKEIEFIAYSCSDLHYDQIAEKMNVSPRTVDGYRDSCYAKLQIKTRPGLVLFALQSGLVAPHEEK